MNKLIHVVITIVFGTLIMPVMANNDGRSDHHSTHLVRTKDGVPVTVTQEHCYPQGANGTEVCKKSGERYQVVLAALQKAGFVESTADHHRKNLVIYEVTVTPVDGVGYSVRNVGRLTGNLSMEIRGGIYPETDLQNIAMRLDQARLIFMTGARTALQ